MCVAHYIEEEKKGNSDMYTCISIGTGTRTMYITTTVSLHTLVYMCCVGPCATECMFCRGRRANEVHVCIQMTNCSALLANVYKC